MPEHEPDAVRARGLREDAAPWIEAEGAARAPALVRERLCALHELAAEDDIAIAPPSEEGLVRFMVEESVAVRPAIGLLDSGELRAVWQVAEDQVGLRFMTDGRIAFVCLARREGSDDLARSYGVEDADRVMPIVEALGLHPLLRG